MSPAALERAASIAAGRPLDPGVLRPADRDRQLGQEPDLQHPVGGHAVPDGRAAGLDERPGRARGDGRARRPPPPRRSTGGPSGRRTPRRTSPTPPTGRWSSAPSTSTRRSPPTPSPPPCAPTASSTPSPTASSAGTSSGSRCTPPSTPPTSRPSPRASTSWWGSCRSHVYRFHWVPSETVTSPPLQRGGSDGFTGDPVKPQPDQRVRRPIERHHPGLLDLGGGRSGASRRRRRRRPAWATRRRRPRPAGTRPSGRPARRPRPGRWRSRSQQRAIALAGAVVRPDDVDDPAGRHLAGGRPAGLARLEAVGEAPAAVLQDRRSACPVDGAVDPTSPAHAAVGGVDDRVDRWAVMSPCTTSSDRPVSERLRRPSRCR